MLTQVIRKHIASVIRQRIGRFSMNISVITAGYSECYKCEYAVNNATHSNRWNILLYFFRSGIHAF